MNRVFTLIVLGGALVVIALLAMPFILASRDSTGDEYLTEMASWHVKWTANSSVSERNLLIDALQDIRTPLGSESIEMLDRHRIYVAAHVIALQADELAILALDNLEGSPGTGILSSGSDCDRLLVGDSDFPQVEPGSTELAWAHKACELRREAKDNLVIVRSEAQAGWLKDYIDKE